MHFVIYEVESFQGQFPADDDKRTANLHPARIAALTGAQVAGAAVPGGRLSIRGQLVADLVVDLDHLAVEIQGIGDVHGLGQYQVAEGARDTCFAIAGRSVHEDGGTRVERRSEPLEGRF